MKQIPLHILYLSKKYSPQRHKVHKEGMLLLDEMRKAVGLITRKDAVNFRKPRKLPLGSQARSPRLTSGNHARSWSETRIGAASPLYLIVRLCSRTSLSLC